MGLGTCLLGWFNEKAVKKVLDIPKRKRINILISMGYPADQEQRLKERRPIDNIRKYVG